MTEVSPIGSVAAPTAEVDALPEPEGAAMLVKQGRPLFGVEMRILGEDRAPLPHDGAASGALWVRGHWVSSGYLDVEQPALDAKGWFPTGDLATIDRFGFMRITDRAKDVIKSGGEWISSVDLENAAAGHPAVTAAAVIGMHHPKSDERPLMVVQCRPGATVDRHAQLPDREGSELVAAG